VSKEAGIKLTIASTHPATSETGNECKQQVSPHYIPKKKTSKAGEGCPFSYAANGAVE